MKNGWNGLSERSQQAFRKGWASWLGALMFYTCLPIPQAYAIEFRWIAQWVPWVGIVVGGLMALLDWALGAMQMPVSVGSTLVIAFGLLLTGGLHLDGVMDTADGLAVPDRSKRLAVMADSRMGAFGGMTAVVLIVLKVMALAAVSSYRPFALIVIAVCGRWGQQWAIAHYPYLKKEGKGAFHKAALPSHSYVLFSGLLLSGLSLLTGVIGLIPIGLAWRSLAAGLTLAVLTSAYFNRQLGGHTGDTYGAVVEWTEALLLCTLTIWL